MSECRRYDGVLSPVKTLGWASKNFCGVVNWYEWYE
jgi:hypothetical protein